jgi:hypothetical protein
MIKHYKQILAIILTIIIVTFGTVFAFAYNYPATVRASDKYSKEACNNLAILPNSYEKQIQSSLAILKANQGKDTKASNLIVQSELKKIQALIRKYPKVDFDYLYNLDTEFDRIDSELMMLWNTDARLAKGDNLTKRQIKVLQEKKEFQTSEIIKYLDRVVGKLEENRVKRADILKIRDNVIESNSKINKITQSQIPIRTIDTLDSTLVISAQDTRTAQERGCPKKQSSLNFKPQRLFAKKLPPKKTSPKFS